MVEKRALDLYTLHRFVQTEGNSFFANLSKPVYDLRVVGGFEVITKDRKWSKVATQMGYPPGKGIGTILKMHYERLLYPFDVFRQGKTPKPIVNILENVIIPCTYCLSLVIEN